MVVTLVGQSDFGWVVSMQSLPRGPVLTSMRLKGGRGSCPV